MRMIFNCLVERSAVGLWWVRLIYVLTRTCLAVGANVSLYIVVTLLRSFPLSFVYFSVPLVAYVGIRSATFCQIRCRVSISSAARTGT